MRDILNMPIPTQDSVIKELQAFSSHSHPDIAQQADAILTEFLELPYDDEAKANELGNKLNQFLIEQNSSFDSASIDGISFNDAIYHTLLQVGYIYPRNARDEFGNIEDIISHESISENCLFISSDRRQWDIKNLYQYFSTQNNQNRNPETKKLFSDRDIQMLNSLAQEIGISRSNSQSNSNRNLAIASRMIDDIILQNAQGQPHVLSLTERGERYHTQRISGSENIHIVERGSPRIFSLRHRSVRDQDGYYATISDLIDITPQPTASAFFYYHIAKYCYLSLAQMVMQSTQAAALTSVYMCLAHTVLTLNTLQQIFNLFRKEGFKFRGKKSINTDWTRTKRANKQSAHKKQWFCTF